MELYRYRELLAAWTTRELQIRYKQSILGGIWAVLQPVVLMLLFALVFSFFVRVPTDGIPYPVFAYTALLPWTFFSNSLTIGTSSLIANFNLVTKIYFPREILPLSSVLTSLVDFAVASFVLVGLMFYYHISIQITFLWLPLLILIQCCFMIGFVLFSSILNAFYRDIRLLVPLLMQAWMYASPIIYPLSSVPERFRIFYLLNPMAGLVDSYRRTILHGLSPDPLALGIAAVVAVIFLVSGYIYFKKSEGVLPDVI